MSRKCELPTETKKDYEECIVLFAVSPAEPRRTEELDWERAARIAREQQEFNRRFKQAPILQQLRAQKRAKRSAARKPRQEVHQLGHSSTVSEGGKSLGKGRVKSNEQRGEKYASEASVTIRHACNSRGAKQYGTPRSYKSRAWSRGRATELPGQMMLYYDKNGYMRCGTPNNQVPSKDKGRPHHQHQKGWKNLGKKENESSQASRDFRSKGGHSRELGS